MIRRILGVVLVVVLLVGCGAVPDASVRPSQSPATPEAQTTRDGQACKPTRSTTLYAEKIGKNRNGFGLSPETASIPGPTLEMYEGECLAVTLVNHLTKDVSLHPHGVNYSVLSDGTRLNGDSCTPPGESRTYVYGAKKPANRADGTVRPGNAGYWHYHDHCLGTDHGTKGVMTGLFGGLIVRRKADPLPDRPPFVVVFADVSINLDVAPATPTFTAKEGERVEFLVITHGDLVHTFHLHGHRWADTRTGLLGGVSDNAPMIDDKVVGPGDSFGFQVVAGEGVGTGAWMYHCHIQGHSDSGMTGLFDVLPKGASVSQPATGHSHAA